MPAGSAFYRGSGKKDSLQAILPRVPMVPLQSWPFDAKNTDVRAAYLDKGLLLQHRVENLPTYFT